MMFYASLLSSVTLCSGHGSMTKPPSWLDPDGHFGTGPGFRGAGCTGKAAPGEVEKAQGCVAEWYSNYTFIPGEPTIPSNSPLLTLRKYLGVIDWTKKNPWRAPGTAPVFSPCGIDGGNPKGCPVGNPGGDGCVAGGYGHGPDGRTLKGNTRPAEWKAGSKVEVAWALTANHGGGYQYRLCPKPTTSYMDLTEDCFQKTPLTFVGDTQWAQYTNGSKVSFPAMRTTEGTTPTGSQWTRNPIPGCYNNVSGPFANGADGVCSGPQFTPPAPGLYGFSPVGIPGFVTMPDFSIVDTVQVPDHLPAGDYVLSFRYDCEQTSQVWNQCADVRIAHGEIDVQI